MSFMAVAYVPAFLEDRATFTKERANGLYGVTPFMISNFLIGLPYLCMYSLLPATCLRSNVSSFDIHPLLHRLILAVQFPANDRSILHLGDVDIPRSCGGRILSGPRDIDIPELCNLLGACRICKWPLDECRRVYGHAEDSQSVLEICVPLHRLPGMLMYYYQKFIFLSE